MDEWVQEPLPQSLTMSTIEILVLGILFLIVIGLQITIFKRLKSEEIGDTSIDYNNQFSEIASSALSKNNEQFLQLADERLKRQQSNASNELESRKKEIETLIQPISEPIKKLEDEINMIPEEIEGIENLKKLLEG